MLRDPPHYLRPLLTTTMPQRLLWLDCQAGTTPEQGLLVERWQAGALGATHWTSKQGERRDELSIHHDPLAMWTVASDMCRPGRRTVLWAHDLAWQLRVSQALIHLPALGWRLDRIVLERTAAWALFRRGNRTMMMCDLRSWAPTDLERIRTDLEIAGALPAAVEITTEMSVSPSVTRCVVIREAVLTILGWAKREGLGPFRPTGSGQSYAGYRRRFLTHKILVHDDVARLELERRAMWTGRCEAWRHGKLTRGPYVEYDMTAAYCQIAATCHVPAIARGVTQNPRLATVLAALDEGAVLAECEIATNLPLVPAQLGDRTVWPVGRFRTVLWDPELTLALAHADEVKITRLWRYLTAPALQDFARWVLAWLDAPADQLPPVCRRVLKHWSRCLVGRLGLRYRAWQKFGTLPEPDLRLITFIDSDEGTMTDLLHAGTDRLILTELTEAADSLPQIPGWIMSECRRRLWEAMDRAGLDNVIYLDTDSLILDPAALKIGHTPLTNGNRDGWHQKGRYSSLTIHGPRNLVAHTTRRVSGLPLDDRQVAPLEYTGQVMRSIKESMRAGELDNVASIPRRFVLDAPDLRRQHHPDGQTTPYQLGENHEAPPADL